MRPPINTAPALATPKKRAVSSAQHKPYHHRDLRASLLAATEQLMTEQGLEAVTLRDVARIAGVSHGAPYYHFSGLEELLAAVAERGFLDLGDAMQVAVTEPDPRERMLRVSDAYVGFAQAQPARFRLMFGPLLSRKDQHPSFKKAAHRAFMFVLAAAQAFDTKNGTSLALAHWSLAHGLSHLLIDGALEGLLVKRPATDTLARQLSERLFKD